MTLTLDGHCHLSKTRTFSLPLRAVLFPICIAVLLLSIGLVPTSAVSQSVSAQKASSTSAVSAETINANAKEVSVDGLVTELRKYSLTIQAGEKTYQVKLVNGAPIGLRMNKPWYDWKNEQVVVDALSYPNDPSVAEPKSEKRVAVKLPADKLFLISRFADTEQMNKTMSTNVKRMNFYLITPKDPGAHLPTEEKPFISGELAIQKNGQTRLQINDQLMPIRLGFRYATMNGFSIMSLEPNKTQVFLSGVTGANENEIIATRVLFQPVRIKSK